MTRRNDGPKRLLTNYEYYGQKTRGEAKEIHKKWQMTHESDIGFLEWLELPHLRQEGED